MSLETKEFHLSSSLSYTYSIEKWVYITLCNRPARRDCEAAGGCWRHGLSSRVERVRVMIQNIGLFSGIKEETRRNTIQDIFHNPLSVPVGGATLSLLKSLEGLQILCGGYTFSCILRSDIRYKKNLNIRKDQHRESPDSIWRSTAPHSFFRFAFICLCNTDRNIYSLSNYESSFEWV